MWVIILATGPICRLNTGVLHHSPGRSSPALRCPAMRPEMKTFSDLRSGDFERHAVWAPVSTNDYDEAWYDDEDIDEETFRPHRGELPVSPAAGMFLVAATATLADGTIAPGFITPAHQSDLGTLQPHITAGDAPPTGFGAGSWVSLTPSGNACATCWVRTKR